MTPNERMADALKAIDLTMTAILVALVFGVATGSASLFWIAMSLRGILDVLQGMAQ